MPDGSNPGWVRGYIPSAPEWNDWWSRKLDTSDPAVTGGPFMSLSSGGNVLGPVTHSSTTSLAGVTTVGTDTVAAALQMDGAAGSTRNIRWQTAGVSRWQIAALGANDDFQMNAYDNSGANLGALLTITRLTGVVSFDPNRIFPSATWTFTRPIYTEMAINQTRARTLVAGSAMSGGATNPLGFNQNIAWSGVIDAGSPSFNSLVTNDTVAVSQAVPTMWQLAITENYNTGAQSARGQLNLTFNKNAPSSDGGNGDAYNMGVFMHYDTGDSTNPAAPLGRATNVNFDCRIGTTGVTGIYALNQINCESDIRLYTGNSVQSKINWNLHNGTGDGAHGAIDDIALCFDASPNIAPGTGGTKTLIGAGRSGQSLPWDANLAGTAVFQLIPNNSGNQVYAWNPTITYGIDLHGAKLTYAWRSTGFWMDGAGQIPVLGPGAVTYSANGLKLDVPNVRAVSATIANGGANYKLNDVVVSEAMGGLWQITGVGAGGTVTSVALVTGYTGYGPAPTGPVATKYGSGNGALTLNVTTATTGLLTLGSAGQTVEVGAGSPTTPLGVASKAYVDGRAPARLYSVFASVGNGADTTLDTLQSFTLAAGQLANVGDRLHVQAGGTFIGSTDNKTAGIRFGSSGQVAGITVTSAGQTAWVIDMTISKSGSNTQSIVAIAGAVNNQSASNNTTLNQTDTGTLLLYVTGQNATNPTANSITCRYFTVDYLPA